MAITVPHVGGNISTPGDTATSDSWTSTSGSLIVVIGHTFGTTGSAANGDVTDSKGNSYTLITSDLIAGSIGIAAYYNNGGTRGASHTVTFNGPGSGTFVNVAVIEISGTNLTLDGTTFATASDTTSPFSVTAAAALSGTQIGIYGATLSTGSNSAWTQPTGYTNIINQGGGDLFLVSDAAYKINETGTPSPGGSGGWTVSAAREIFVSFMEGSAAVAASAPNVNFATSIV